ncbi:hypothetical protein ES708_04503 [subsurface metagenome]
MRHYFRVIEELFVFIPNDLKSDAAFNIRINLFWSLNRSEMRLQHKGFIPAVLSLQKNLYPAKIGSGVIEG